MGGGDKNKTKQNKQNNTINTYILRVHDPSSNGSRSRKRKPDRKEAEIAERKRKTMIHQQETIRNAKIKNANEKLRPELTGFCLQRAIVNDLPLIPLDPKFLGYPFPEDRFPRYQTTTMDRSEKVPSTLSPITA